METIFVLDFASNTFSATVETQNEIASYLSSITPNNFLSFLDFLKNSGIIVTEDFVDEIDYSVAEY